MAYPKTTKRTFLNVAEATRRTMAANSSTETKPEVNLRKALWAAGVRGYRKNVRKLPGKPDIVFGPRKVAIFIDGCFWHACPHCGRFVYPKKNADYWHEKIESNKRRDVEVRAQLERQGYTVLTVWDCEVKKHLQDCVIRVRQALGAQTQV